jgi:hypothetical protein
LRPAPHDEDDRGDAVVFVWVAGNDGVFGAICDDDIADRRLDRETDKM